MNRSIGLDALSRDAKRDFGRLNHPPANWPAGRLAPDGKPALDVLIVGGGQFGQTAALALIREGIRHIRVIDRARRGEEGPWATTARMHTLRSPKHLTGPDLGFPCLTYRAWFEAQHGEAGWEALYKIDRRSWVDYLLWVRDVADIPVTNEIAATALDPAGDLLRATLVDAAGRHETVFARQVVLATGRDGFGGSRLPEFPSFAGADDSGGRIVHTGDPIDFARFCGGRVAVLGANASAFDAAATALEAGATVTLWCRRPHLPQVNFTRGMVFSGFLRGFAHLPDSTRWAVMSRMADEAAPPPHESVLRCEAHAGFELRFREGWSDLRLTASGVVVSTPSGAALFDAAVLATGFATDLSRLPALARFHADALLWRDRIEPAAAARYPELAQHPYLDDGFALTERQAGSRPDLRRLRLFGPAAALSHGTLAGDIPGLAPGALRLARAVADALFLDEAETHVGGLFDYEEPELAPTNYFVPLAQRSRPHPR